MSTIVFRHHDTIGLSCGERLTKTVYLTPHQARKFAKILIAAADDIDKQNYLESTFEAWSGVTLDC